MTIVVPALLTVAWILSPPAASAAPSTVDSVYASGVRHALRASGVPVWLPVPIPRDLGTARSIVVLVADQHGYEVAVSAVAGCAGSLACASFHVAGYAARRETMWADRRAHPVVLADGAHAWYVPEDCSGAACVEAALCFERDGVIYELDVKAGPHADERVLRRAYRSLRLLPAPHQ